MLSAPRAGILFTTRPANFWDWYDQPRMPLGPATGAFRLGVNYMVYALTH